MINIIEYYNIYIYHLTDKMRVNAIMPVCTSCGSSIGEKYEIYNLIQVQRVKKYCKENSCSINDSATFMEKISMRDVLDALNVKNMCCRGKLLGFNRNICNVYK